MKKSSTIKVGLIGSGFIAAWHMYAYQRVYGIEVEVVAVSARGGQAEEFAKKYQIPTVYHDYHDLLRDKAIDVIDICTPPALHSAMIVEAVHHGKHVIAEKPFTGYFGRPEDKSPIGKRVKKSLMYECVLEEMDRTSSVIKKSGRLFMYAEDWVYAPAMTKVAEMIRATKDKILWMKAEASHSGSHAAHAAEWSMNGGGALIRMGCHPLAAVLHLKQVEARARNEAITVASVVADVGNLTSECKLDERAYIQSNPVDVEDWGMIALTFSDGTKSTIASGDMVLGGVRNQVEAYTSGGVLLANIAPNNHLMSYMTDEDKLSDVYITEKVDRKTGWQFVCLEEEWTRGFLQEMQDFMECVALGREPLSGLGLAYETTKIHYAAYWSAEEGKRIRFS